MAAILGKRPFSKRMEEDPDLDRVIHNCNITTREKERVRNPNPTTEDSCLATHGFLPARILPPDPYNI